MKPLIRETQDKRFVEVIGHYDNPVLCAKLTLLADMFAVEHKEGYAKFRIEDEGKLSFIDDKLEFVITDLTGTKWVFNNSAPAIPSAGAHFNNIEFISNNTNYSSIVILMYGDRIFYDDTVVYNGSWDNQAYRIISITGGTDVTNADLVAWLEANATQIQVDDLTDTKWSIDDQADLTLLQTTFNVNFISNNTNYTSIYFGWNSGTHAPLYYDNTQVADGGDNPTTWTNISYRIISITNGTDVSNPDLLVWLNNNATLVPVVDLTNTTWIFDESLDVSIDDSFFINFTSDYDNFTSIYPQNDLGQEPPVEYLWYGKDDNLYYENPYEDGIWDNNSHKTISIAGGTDTSNPDLIVWLTENATLQEEPSVVTYTITPTLTHITSSNTTYTIDENGTWTTTLTADTGYDLPSSVSVTNATVSSYNSTTGELTLSNPTGNVTLVATATEHPQPSTNKISFGNLPIDKVLFGSLEVEKMYLGNVLIYENQGYVYSQSGTELTIENAPYSQSGSELTIL